MTDSQNRAIKIAVNDDTYSRKDSLPDTGGSSRAAKKVVLKLPPPGNMRWGARSKAAVITAIRGGVLTLSEACEQYALSAAEYRSWEAAYDALGLEGLGLVGRQLRRRALTYCEK